MAKQRWSIKETDGEWLVYDDGYLAADSLTSEEYAKEFIAKMERETELEDAAEELVRTAVDTFIKTKNVSRSEALEAFAGALDRLKSWHPTKQ